MNSTYPCPVCTSQDWKTVQEYVYHVADHESPLWIGNNRAVNATHLLKDFWRAIIHNAPKPDRIRERLLSDYELMMREILFTVWVPGQREMRMASRYCRRCGFMACTPRPDTHEIALKYRALEPNTHPDDIHRQNAFLDSDPYSRRSRAQLREVLIAGVGQERFRLLDHGGASGWYVKSLADQGCVCDLVDYEPQQLPGIRRIGVTIDDIPESGQYDAIVSRAVLEHLVDPCDVLRKFHRRLVDRGVVYALVPCEIHAGIARLGYDPVTHINFFTPNSFSLMFRRNGFVVERSGMDEMRNIWVLARKQQGHAQDASILAPDTDTYLYPGRMSTFNWYIINRLVSRLWRR